MENKFIGLKVEDITEEFIKKYDGVLVWIRDDYLIMRNYSSGYTLDILNRVAEIKSKMRESGYIFKA